MTAEAVSLERQAKETPAAVEAAAERDHWLLLVTVLLVAAGLVMVLSASQARALLDSGDPLYYFKRQAIAAGLGIAAMVALMRLDYHRLRRLALPLVAATALLLLLVPVAGVEANGARRWFALGPVVIQPTELAKLPIALFFAHWCVKRGARLRELADGFVPFTLLVFAALGLVMLERDLGTTLVMAALVLSACLAAGGRKWHLIVLVLALAGLAVAVVVLEPYRFARLAVFTNPFGDQLGAGFQSTQALYALGSGGFFGVGLGHSVQKFLWLPESHTDFIFAIIGEETGLAGTTTVLSAFLFFAVRGYRAALRAPDRLGLVLAAAITTWVSFQALVNMATVTDTLPITGVPLPLISYGGSSVATSLAAIGVLLNIASQGAPQPLLGTRRRADATVDLGRRDRWTPDARARRRASASR